MQSPQKTMIASSIALILTPIPNAQAADDYVSGATYSGGAEVCHLGDLYRAKWWAGPSDLPTDVDTVAAPWETPWERVESGPAECGIATPGNQPPTVSAAASRNPADPSGATPVELIASGADADGDALSFQWAQVPNAAPSVAIANPDQAAAQVVLPQVTETVVFAFRVTVSDGDASATADVQVTLAPMPGNQAPVALAAATPAEIVGAGDVVLSATGASDPDGDVLTYRWQQVSPTAPQAVIDDPDAVAPTVSLPAPGADLSYVFEVVVGDGELTSSARATVVQRVAGTEPVACPAWDSGATYVEGDRVSHAGGTWRAGWWTRGDEPGTTGEWGVWRLADAAASCAGGVDPDPDPDPGTDPDPRPGDPVYLSDLLAREAALTDTPLMQAVQASIATRDNATVEAVGAGDPANPANVKRVEGILSPADWESLFPRRAPEYTYENFLKAIAKFPAFCGDYADGRDAEAICRKALATMFAHFTQETGGHTIAWAEPEWRQGLVYLRELGWSEDMPNGYGLCDPGTWQGATWPCAVFPDGHPSAGQFKSYFGRGAKQLSYNYNYGPFSEAMFGDVATLLDQPNLVADTWLNLASAVFFYAYPQPPKPSMLHALDGTWVPNAHDLANGLEPGFGVTTQIINGGIECGGSTEHIQSQNRIGYYLNFADYLEVPVAQDEVLGCANMQRFDTAGSGALAIYWEQDWSAPNACKLVNYQTPFSAFKQGDYVSCVQYHFDVEVIDDL